MEREPFGPMGLSLVDRSARECRKGKIMSFMRCLTFGCVLGLALLFFVSPARAQAQTTKPADSAQGDLDQTLKQLLTEVRELRLAVQRATANNTRFQMLIERVRVQQAHVDALSRQLESVHSQVAEMKATKPQMEQQIKDAEDQLDRTPDPNAHADLESRIKGGKANLARFTQEDERLHNRETVLDAELQAAQGKLNELNNQLDGLMTELKGP
jgi:chromosome segregation ATPase